MSHDGPVGMAAETLHLQTHSTEFLIVYGQSGKILVCSTADWQTTNCVIEKDFGCDW